MEDMIVDLYTTRYGRIAIPDVINDMRPSYPQIVLEDKTNGKYILYDTVTKEADNLLKEEFEGYLAGDCVDEDLVSKFDEWYAVPYTFVIRQAHKFYEGSTYAELFEDLGIDVLKEKSDVHTQMLHDLQSLVGAENVKNYIYDQMDVRISGHDYYGVYEPMAIAWYNAQLTAGTGKKVFHGFDHDFIYDEETSDVRIEGRWCDGYKVNIVSKQS